jgi:hypothetical protein
MFTFGRHLLASFSRLFLQIFSKLLSAHLREEAIAPRLSTLSKVYELESSTSRAAHHSATPIHVSPEAARNYPPLSVPHGDDNSSELSKPDGHEVHIAFRAHPKCAGTCVRYTISRRPIWCHDVLQPR